MRIALASSIALIGVTLAGCAGARPAPQTQDVGFVYGCWVEKDDGGGRVNAFLRLLPEGPDGEAYAGYLQFVRGIKPAPEVHIAIARDGGRASVTLDGVLHEFPAGRVAGATGGDRSRRITFAGTSNGRSGAITAVGGPDRLTLTVASGVRRLAFDGERDGCD